MGLKFCVLSGFFIIRPMIIMTDDWRGEHEEEKAKASRLEIAVSRDSRSAANAINRFWVARRKWPLISAALEVECKVVSLVFRDLPALWMHVYKCVCQRRHNQCNISSDNFNILLLLLITLEIYERKQLLKLCGACQRKNLTILQMRHKTTSEY